MENAFFRYKVHHRRWSSRAAVADTLLLAHVGHHVVNAHFRELAHRSAFRETCFGHPGHTRDRGYRTSENRTMTPTPARPILEFRPWATWARTILYEYYCMSWATRIAAERTTHPPLAARLVGESFELAFKLLHILSQGPEQELKFGHSLGALIRHTQPLERLLKNLWGGDLDYVIDILDGECSPSQVRYGAGGGKSKQAEPNSPERLRGDPWHLDLKHAHAVRGVDVLVGTDDLVELSNGATGTVTPWCDALRWSP